MKANESKVLDFMSKTSTQFVIPVYQRNYDWKVEHCKQLLEDIILVGKSDNIISHFIGSIVYIHDGIYMTSKVNKNKLQIIDGQQRLTTLNLLFFALAHYYKGIDDEEFLRINETYLINKYVRDDEKFKLRQTDNNQKYFKKLLSLTKGEDDTEYSKILINFRYFLDNLNSNNIEIIDKGLNKLVFVEISLDRNNDNPQRIFESLNSTGLDLSQADLIRNYILMDLEHDTQERIYNEYWEYIELLTTYGEVNYVSEFIRDYLTFKTRKITNKGRVYEEFKLMYVFENNVEELERVLIDLKRIAIFYNKIQNPLNEKKTQIRLQLEYLRKLEINIANPFILELYCDYEDGLLNTEAFCELLELIQSFYWRRFIVGIPDKGLNNIFTRLTKDIDKTNYKTSIMKNLSKHYFPTDIEIKNALKIKNIYGTQPKSKNYFLERLENFENREPIKMDDVTIEHVFPQTPDIEWKRKLSSEEFKAIETEYLHTIGNLTLSGYNNKLRNKYFTEKRDLNIDEQELGYKFSRLWLNRSLGNLEKWDIEEINKRTEVIFERFVKIWKYSIADFVVADDSDELDIFDIDDPTDKKLDYAVFYGQKINVKNMTELYEELLNQLFKIEPEIFDNDKIQNTLKITKNKSKLAQAGKLGEEFFFEKKMSNKSKLEKLKYVLKESGFDSDLKIKFSNY